MDAERDKLKNIKDLEYNHLLNKQGIFLGIFATIVISIVLAENIPENVGKLNLVFTFILSFILILLYYGKKLEDKISEIRSI